MGQEIFTFEDIEIENNKFYHQFYHPKKVLVSN